MLSRGQLNGIQGYLNESVPTAAFSAVFYYMLLIKNLKNRGSRTSFAIRKCVNHGDSGRKWFVRPWGGHTDLNIKLSTEILQWPTKRERWGYKHSTLQKQSRLKYLMWESTSPKDSLMFHRTNSWRRPVKNHSGEKTKADAFCVQDTYVHAH